MIDDPVREKTAHATALPPTTSVDQQLLELAKVYKLLKLALDTMADLSLRVRKEAPWAEADEKSYQARLEPITGRMYEMAWEAAGIRARTIAGANAKGEILLDWCEDLQGNLRDGLASSLCIDLECIAGGAQYAQAAR